MARFEANQGVDDGILVGCFGLRIEEERCPMRVKSIVSSAVVGSLRFLPVQRLVKVRARLLRLAGVNIDLRAQVYGTQTIFNPENISIANAFVNAECFFDGNAAIRIGHRVHIGPRVMFLTTNHVGESSRDRVFMPITVLDGAWIGAGAVIVPGVTIGEDSVVAAGAVVTKDVPSGVRVAGVPARPIS